MSSIITPSFRSEYPSLDQFGLSLPSDPASDANSSEVLAFDQAIEDYNEASAAHKAEQVKILERRRRAVLLWRESVEEKRVGKRKADEASGSGSKRPRVSGNFYFLLFLF